MESRLPHEFTNVNGLLFFNVNAFSQTVVNNPFDFKSDGTIEAGDFAKFGNRFGLTL